MKVFNVIAVWDVVTVAENEMDAIEAVMGAIRNDEEPEPVSTATALEAREEKNIRQEWKEKKPFVGALVSDGDFAKLKGKTSTEIRAMIYSKPEPK